MKINEKNLLYMLSYIRKKAFEFLQSEMTKKGIEDISPSYGDVLFALGKNDGLSIKEICELTQKDKSTVSIIVNKLVKSGYAEKIRSNEDKRAVLIRLNEKAKSQGDKMMEISKKLHQKLYNGLSEEEKTIFFILLNKIGKNL